ncbi:MAG: LysR family transcriptional regulator [Pseudomonadota bacterium]
MSLTLARIRALNAVIETGGVSSAAKHLSISQPAVTQAIRDIERDTGVTLFVRRGRDLVPTALAADLFRLTVEIERTSAEADRLLQQHGNLGQSELRVGLGNSMPGMALIGAFRERFPGIRISVEQGSWSQIIDAVVEGRVEVGVLPNVPDDGRFVRKTCLIQDVVAIVNEADPLAGRSQVTCDQLMRYPLIFRTAKSSTQRVVDRGFAAAGLSPKPSLVLDTRDGVYEAVANGLGVGFVWESGSGRRDRIRRLRVIDFEQGHPEHVFHLAGRTLPLAAAFASIQL